MEVTEIRISLARGPRDGRLLAYATFVLGGRYAVRDVKIVDGPSGPFASMPCRPQASRCGDRGGSCDASAPATARFCPSCGSGLAPSPGRERGRRALYTDLFHPVDEATRRYLTQALLAAYRDELARHAAPAPAPAATA